MKRRGWDTEAQARTVAGANNSSRGVVRLPDGSWAVRWADGSLTGKAGAIDEPAPR